MPNLLTSYFPSPMIEVHQRFSCECRRTVEDRLAHDNLGHFVGEISYPFFVTIYWPNMRKGRHDPLQGE